jgi:hypothetical protein
MKAAIDETTLAEREKIVERFGLSENQRLEHCCKMYTQTAQHLEKANGWGPSAERLFRMIMTMDARISRAISQPVRDTKIEGSEEKTGEEGATKGS